MINNPKYLYFSEEEENQNDTQLSVIQDKDKNLDKQDDSNTTQDENKTNEEESGQIKDQTVETTEALEEEDQIETKLENQEAQEDLERFQVI